MNPRDTEEEHDPSVLDDPEPKRGGVGGLEGPLDDPGSGVTGHGVPTDLDDTPDETD